jgi:hypothetical protein
MGIMHPLQGESVENLMARLRPPLPISEYYWYATKEALFEDKRDGEMALPRRQDSGVTREDSHYRTMLLFSPSPFPEGVGHFPDEFGSVPGLRSEQMDRYAKFSWVEWEGHSRVGTGTLRLAGTIHGHSLLEDRDYWQRVVLPWMDGMKEMVLHLVHQCAPAFASCGESVDPEHPALRASRRHDLWFLNWVNVFGPAYVKEYGKDFLLGAPGFRKEELPGGYILYQVTEGFAPWEAENPAPKVVEDYFNTHEHIREVVYRPWLKQALASRWRPSGHSVMEASGGGDTRRKSVLRRLRQGRKSKHPAPHETSEGLHGLANATVDSARDRLEVTLDYSPQSLEVLDDTLERFFAPDEPLLSTTIISFGAYLGETIIHNLGGRWRPAADWRDCAVVDIGPVAEAFPMRRVMKRVEEGRESSLYAWYAAIERRALGR